MRTEVVFAGFGGQGVLVAGKLLALAGLESGFEVSWLPSYGPEMRGGTANCVVIISDRVIASPVVDQSAAAVVLNQPSLDKFSARIRPGGHLVVNTSLVRTECTRDDISITKVPANQIAIDLGSPRSTNMAALGAYLACLTELPFDAVDAQIAHQFADKKAEVVTVNREALRRGYEHALAGQAASR